MILFNGQGTNGKDRLESEVCEMFSTKAFRLNINITQSYNRIGTIYLMSSDDEDGEFSTEFATNINSTPVNLSVKFKENTKEFFKVVYEGECGEGGELFVTIEF